MGQDPIRPGRQKAPSRGLLSRQLQRESDTDVLRVDAASDLERLRPLDDRATVVKQRYLVWVRVVGELRPEQELVRRHVRMALQACGQRRQVDRGGLHARP